MMKHLVRFGLLVITAMLGHAVAADSCGFWHEISFADGAKVCMNQSAIGALKPVGFDLNLTQLNSRARTNTSVSMAIAVSDGDGSCPLIAGFVPPVVRTAYIETKAIQLCNSGLTALGRFRQGTCSCRTLAIDGVSPMAKVDFDKRLASATAPNFANFEAPRQDPSVVQSTSNRPATSPTTNSPGDKTREQPAAGLPTPASIPNGGTAPPSQADMDWLRGQIALLRAQSEAAALNKGAQIPAASERPPSSLPVTPIDSKIDKAPPKSAQALIIGNSAYTDFGKLPNPRNDARAIAAKLRSFGVEVDLILDADRGALVNALNQYQSKAVGKDVNILYYAGHGVQVNGVNYLVPTDMRADGVTAGYIKLNGVSLNDALDYLPAKTKLVFLDACRDNPASRSLVASRSAGAVGLAPVNTATGTLIAYATKEGATADDGNGANSPYTTALLENLDAQVDIGIVLRKVRQRVMQLTSGRQEPWEYGSLMGDQLVLSTMAK